MNDRFKFRVWFDGRFIYKSLCDSNVYTEDDKCICLANTLPDLPWEQCTGLKDKNGKLIYEGDIIQTDYEGVELDKYIYRWESPAFYVEPIEKGKPTGSHYYYYAVCTERSTVIGNIHQNPELLKESK